MVKAKAIRRAAGIVAFNAVVASVVVEGTLVLLLAAPRLSGVLPRPARRLVQQVYRHFKRSLIQFDQACARYDPELTYTLKPGVCTFENTEFRNVYRVNRLGLRDGEDQLDAPQVIVLGDSHVMGWGVDQDETLTRVLAQKAERRVLNAGVSSYGTAREIQLLERLDVSRLDTLIIQYSDNDWPENRTFHERGQFLPVMNRAQYEKAVEHYQAQRGYFPGKYLYRMFAKALRLEEPEPDQVTMGNFTPTEEAEAFVNVLAHSRVPLAHVQVIVFEINEQIRPPRPFIAVLDTVRRQAQHPEFVRRLQTLDVAPLLSPGDFYDLDDHLRAHGHQVLGEALSDLVSNLAGLKSRETAAPGTRP